jgi:hypothetical protein
MFASSGKQLDDLLDIVRSYGAAEYKRGTEALQAVTAECDALKAQEPAYLIQSDGRCFAYSGAKPLGPGHADATLLKLYLAAGAQGIPEGYQLVPMEPTQEMLTAGHQCPVIDDGSEDGSEDYRAVYKAMLIAAKEQS